MRYMGGKFKIRKEVSGILKMLRAPGQICLEPFVGGGYARGSVINFADTVTRGLLKQLNYLRDVEFKYGGYDTHAPDNMLVYCDPPVRWYVRL